MATRNVTTITSVPPEVILDILSHLKKKRDWFALARTCRHASVVIVPELDKFNSDEGLDYAFWYSCVASNFAILEPYIARDRAVVNRHFTRDFTNKRMKFPCGKGMTPLAVAILSGRDLVVQLLLRNGADPNLPDRAPMSPNSVIWYPINWAVASKHESSIAIIKMLKDYSANINQEPGSWSPTEGIDESPVEWHRGMKCAPIFRLLLLEKPHRSSSLRKQQTSCEMYNKDFKTIQDIRLRQLRALLECGANTSLREEEGGSTPVDYLLQSVMFYQPCFYFSDKLMLSHEEEEQARLVNNIVISFLETLREFGVDTTTQLDSFGYTLLHVVCTLTDRHKPLIHWFLRNGADINRSAINGDTPLMEYCHSRMRSVDMFKEFLSYRPRVNHRNTQCQTALHFLCANSSVPAQVQEKAVRMMLDAGANPTAETKQGVTPAYEFAMQKMHDARASAEVIPDLEEVEKFVAENLFKDDDEGVWKMLKDAEEEWKEHEIKKKGRQIRVPTEKRTVRLPNGENQ
ncbi:ankyrin repeat-containing domain protein [Xylaria bambusicola]|uniref:ankyrin repeat-containing domain protein n=1 Tax=Xylaria bambusicola TaxID=326684 RepID=UPI0020082558|nr:ankyrin repeat-containing domain protein [Xylaria bambusicola]KAI0505608.1 ankyrin repeat-containing domain protein [Xylaria bambusicola]